MYLPISPRTLAVLGLALGCSACFLFPGKKSHTAPPCAAARDAPQLTYAFPTDSGSNGDCTIPRPDQEVRVEQDADGRHCVDLQTVAYMGFRPKQIEMDNRYTLVTDGGESAVFSMETLEIEKVGTCYGSSDPVGIWLWQRRGCVEAPADIDTSSTLALRWMPKMNADREMARWDFTGRTTEEDPLRTDPICEVPDTLATK
jgi:hypothetical protein